MRVSGIELSTLISDPSPNKVLQKINMLPPKYMKSNKIVL